MYEGTVDFDLASDDLRSKLVQENVKLRKAPRQTITFTPTRDLTGTVVPRLGIDYNVGDIVRFRAVERFPAVNDQGVTIGQQETKTVDSTFRVYAVELDLDDAGAATPTLTLVPS